MSGWRVRAVALRRHNAALRWQLECRRDGQTIVAVADTTRDGQVLDLQSESAVGTTGDAALDNKIHNHIADVLALRRVLRTLDELERPRSRSDRLRPAA